MDQYFSQSPDVVSDPKTWRFELRERTFRFTTDNGVFSKNEVDYGSRVLIESFVLPKAEGDIVDVGCGYGPISIALAASFPERKVLGVDVNQRALQLAQQNAEQNRIDNVLFKESNILAGVSDRRFAAILTNPPIRAGKQVVHQIFEEAQQSILPGGELWVVIQKKQGAPSAKRKLEELFEEVSVVAKDKGYFIFCAK
ncbi:class I SAM-dependent methyltransferase [Gracilibacillus caseinilyticus]|uniref:Class I SAM-dependent methyltransferase n=2 Tax=Gracilibacillus caseinilyticus TaxID=2932256 RepID=A0ABY4EYI1_9BACI|nr:class I SAM-dependent methyltransferase [Gracilibacillus caseinilyticus]UOQ49465.1 class I SAM-dependent methyltransferase [Gracilibacillus caseinilyticus]